VVDAYEEAEALVNRIRAEVKSATGCDCSGGIGNSKVTATLALIEAKPNGCVLAPQLTEEPLLYETHLAVLHTTDKPSLVIEANGARLQSIKPLGQPSFIVEHKGERGLLGWLSQFEVRRLRGVGYATIHKLESIGISKLNDLWSHSLVHLDWFVHHVVALTIRH